jgi:hypothetical protein
MKDRILLKAQLIQQRSTKETTMYQTRLSQLEGANHGNGYQEAAQTESNEQESLHVLDEAEREACQRDIKESLFRIQILEKRLNKVKRGKSF